MFVFTVHVSHHEIGALLTVTLYHHSDQWTSSSQDPRLLLGVYLCPFFVTSCGTGRSVVIVFLYILITFIYLRMLGKSLVPLSCAVNFSGVLVIIALNGLLNTNFIRYHTYLYNALKSLKIFVSKNSNKRNVKTSVT